jgi:hypothetical protein
MDACLARLFHPAMEGGHLAPAQDGAKTKNQLAHDSEARTLPLSVSTICACWLVNSARTLLNSAVATCGRQLSGPRRACLGQEGLSENANIGYGASARWIGKQDRRQSSDRELP